MDAHACRHIQNAKKYGIPVVIAINKFATDTDAELQAVKTASKDAGKSRTRLCCVLMISTLAAMRLDVHKSTQCTRKFMRPRCDARCQCEIIGGRLSIYPHQRGSGWGKYATGMVLPNKVMHA